MLEIPSSQDPKARIEGLGRFLEHWLGPRDESYGEPAEYLAGASLPEPLLALHRLAGRWPSPNPDLSRKPSAFCAQDALRPASRVQLSDDDKLIFADAADPVGTWATLPEGEDPPVWLRTGSGSAEGPWKEVSESLSDFLVGHCLKQLVLGATLWREDEGLLELFEKERSASTLLWRQSSPQRSFHLWRETVLVAEHRLNTSFAAQEGSRLSFTQSSAGEIIGLSVDASSRWSLEVHADGSGRAWLADADLGGAVFPAGTLDFAATRDRFLELAGEETRARPAVYFHRTGQSFCRGCEVSDETALRPLFERVRALATERDANFDAFYSARPPFPQQS